MSPGKTTAPQEVGFLLVPGFPLMALSAATEPLRAANRLAGRNLYRWTLISADGRPVASGGGMQIVADVVQLSGDAATAAADKLRAKYSHLGDTHLQSHFYALKPTRVDYIHGAADGDEEFEPLGVNWTREQF